MYITTYRPLLTTDSKDLPRERGNLQFYHACTYILLSLLCRNEVININSNTTNQLAGGDRLISDDTFNGPIDLDYKQAAYNNQVDRLDSILNIHIKELYVYLSLEG